VASKFSPTLEKIWKESLGEEVYDKLPEEHKIILTRISLGYILRIYSFNNVKQIGRKIPFTFPQWSNLRSSLLHSGDCVLGIKIYLIACIHKELNREKIDYNLLAKNCDILPEDIKLIRHLEILKLKNLLIPIVRGIPIEMQSLKEIKSDCRKVLEEISPFVRKFVYKKFFFIYSSNGFDPDDIINDLLGKAIETFYFLTPFYSVEHRSNSVKRAVHNYGIKIIQFYTDESRNRNANKIITIGDEEEKFVITSQDGGIFHGISHSNESEDSSTKNLNIGNAVYSPTASSDKRLENIQKRNDVRSLYRNAEGNRKIIMSLLMAYENKEFVSFTNSFTKKKFTSTEEIHNAFDLDYYLELVKRFTNLPFSIIENVMENLATSLKDHR